MPRDLRCYLVGTIKGVGKIYLRGSVQRAVGRNSARNDGVLAHSDGMIP